MPDDLDKFKFLEENASTWWSRIRPAVIALLVLYALYLMASNITCG